MIVAGLVAVTVILTGIAIRGFGRGCPVHKGGVSA